MTSPGVVVVDGDRYPGLRLPRNFTLTELPERVGMCGVLRWAFQTHPDLPFYGFMSDDLFPETPGWDLALESSAGSWGLASSNDKWRQGQRMAGNLCFGGALVRAVGFWAPEGMDHLWWDDVWEHVARQTGGWTYRGDVIVEHRHFGNGKASHDATYNRKQPSEDHAVFQQWRDDPATAERLAAIREARAPVLQATDTVQAGA